MHVVLTVCKLSFRLSEIPEILYAKHSKTVDTDNKLYTVLHYKYLSLFTYEYGFIRFVD